MTVFGGATGTAAALASLDQGVLVVGAGLIGTSIALCLTRAGLEVHLTDEQPGRAQLAADLGAGQTGPPAVPPALVVVAVPAAAVAEVVERYGRRYLDATFTDVASVKSYVQVDVDSRNGIADRFVGGHPMSGRERSGAAVADADLFDGRPWVLTPGARSEPVALARAQALVGICRADLVVTNPERHDEAVALVSHMPQLMASLVAGRLTEADADLISLAGPGIRDVTRIAGSDPALWTGILAANSAAVVSVLDALARDLDLARTSLRQLSGEASSQTSALLDLLEHGRRGHRRLPGKHGGRPADYSAVQVVVSDQPGQLARLFTAADEAAINIEDVSIEHAPGHPVGVVELMVRPDAADALAAALRERGWTVHL